MKKLGWKYPQSQTALISNKRLSPDVLDRVQVRWTLWMIQKTNVFNLEKNPLTCEQCELQHYSVEISSLLHTNEPLQSKGNLFSFFKIEKQTRIEWQILTQRHKSRTWFYFKPNLTFCSMVLKFWQAKLCSILEYACFANLMFKM